MLATIRESPGYRGVAWKIAADALFELSVISVFADEGKVRAAMTMVYEFIQGQSSDQLAGLFKFTALSPDDPVTGLNLEAAAAACYYCITVGPPAEPTLPSSLCELAAAPHEWTLKQLSCTVRQASEAANSFLIQALQREPGNQGWQHTYLLQSRLGKPERDVEYMIRGITLLEAAREEPEEPIVEQQSVIAHTNIARLRLGLQDHERSLAALGLLLKDAERESHIIHVQAQYGSGSASFRMDDLQAATTSFQAAWESAADDRVLRGQVTVLLAQTVQLIYRFAIISDPEYLTAIDIPAGIGMLTKDDCLVDAALSEILALPVEQRHELDPRRDVTYFSCKIILAWYESSS
ncbi:hypothetical protein BDR03DRAFT_1065886 [Suillus americanus]|nr:hypothetical protein BDR03DRAFT_1065886 [Suillus americanus]